MGTSAGATTAAQLAGAAPAELYAAVVAGAPPRRTDAPGAGERRERTRQAADQMARTAALIAASRDAADLRRRL
ncbi:patatin, partial [Sphaerisporangium cinnabarinum]